MNRRLVLKQLAALAALALPGGAALAQQRGVGQYQTLATPLPTEVKGKIEVLEFFSYGCPHCHDFDPLLESWLKTQAADVHFIRVPVTFNRPQWVAYARVFYTLEALGELERQHAAVFAALHDQRVPLEREEALYEWAEGRGLDRKKFAEAYKSFGVQSRLQRANQLAASYKVAGVPLLAVNGRYLVSASMAGSFENMLKTADQLIARSRG